MTMSPASFSTISARNSTVFAIYASFRRHATVPLGRSKEIGGRERSCPRVEAGVAASRG
jgi:hypothetical protein